MYTRSKERTERMINRYFKMWNRIIPADSHPFNGVVKLNPYLSYPFNFSFTLGKKYYVINGYILDDEGYACGIDSILKDTLCYGFYEEFPAYPIESFEGLENNIFEVIEKY